MSAKDYFKSKPEGFADKDVYVCESRYIMKYRNFKKIKVWLATSLKTKIVPRDQPLVPKRVVSVFKERVEMHKGELAELQEQEALVEKDKPVCDYFKYKFVFYEYILMIFFIYRMLHSLVIQPKMLPITSSTTPCAVAWSKSVTMCMLPPIRESSQSPRFTLCGKRNGNNLHRGLTLIANII